MSKYKQVGELNGETLYITSKGREIEIQDTLTEMQCRASAKEVAESGRKLATDLLSAEMKEHEITNGKLIDAEDEFMELEEDYIDLLNVYSSEINFNRSLTKFAVYFTGIAAGCAIAMTALAVHTTYPNLFVFPF